jgi:hypothetical protein
VDSFPSTPEGLRRTCQTLEKTLAELLADSNVRKTLGEAARSVVESRRGVVADMVKAVG